MAPAQSTYVFVSYSHADTSLVAPVVRLLRVNKSLVFQDIDSIQAGRRWRNAIAQSLAESHLVVVFWCSHASRSKEVAKEWKAAIEQEKDLLPLLLDATPLPPELGEFQWIDFRGTVGANHGSIDSSANDVKERAPPLMAPVKHGRLSLAVLLSVFAIGWFLWSSTLLQNEQPRPPAVEWQPRPPAVEWQPRPPAVEWKKLQPKLQPKLEPTPQRSSWEPFAFVLSILLLLVVVFAVTVYFVSFRKRKGVPQAAPTAPGELERLVASELEAEILRRTALRRGGGA
jgi:hypothetical protein